tara:strand:+ start:81 stop:1049 length:969 start_codon:yes stop_codon:yes gene_type:complete
MITNKTPKNAKKFICERCNFNCSKQSDFDRHLLTAKHKMITNDNGKTQKIANPHMCECGKKYIFSSGLSRHKQKCTYTTEEEPENTIVITKEESNIDYKAMFIEVMKKNDELHETIREMVPRIGNNNTTNNTNNNTFNVMLYLNDQCKDALSIQKFMTDIEVTEDDVISMSKHKNPTDNFTNLILKSLKNIDITERPFHCTDEHRGTLYIKNDSGWDNDKKRERDREQIKNDESWDKTTAKDDVIANALKKTINIKPFNAITNYRKNHPNSRELDTPEYVLTGKAELNTYCDCTDEEDLSNTTQKVMKNLRPKIRLNKDTVK